MSHLNSSGADRLEQELEHRTLEFASEVIAKGRSESASELLPIERIQSVIARFKPLIIEFATKVCSQQTIILP
jgi:hypothetical protein